MSPARSAMATSRASTSRSDTPMSHEHPHAIKKRDLEEKLIAFLANASAAGTLPMINGRISRSAVVLAIGAAENWTHQNAFARKTLAEWDQRIGQGEHGARTRVPGRRE